MKLQDAIDHFGSRPKVCAALGIGRMNAVYWGYWLPMKHAQNLSHSHPKLNYDHSLYAGRNVVELCGKKYTPATYVSSTRVLEKELSKMARLFFYDGKSIIDAGSLDKDSLVTHFRSYPIYSEVNQ